MIRYIGTIVDTYCTWDDNGKVVGQYVTIVINSEYDTITVPVSPSLSHHYYIGKVLVVVIDDNILYISPYLKDE